MVHNFGQMLSDTHQGLTLMSLHLIEMLNRASELLRGDSLARGGSGSGLIHNEPKALSNSKTKFEGSS